MSSIRISSFKSRMQWTQSSLSFDNHPVKTQTGNSKSSLNKHLQIIRKKHLLWMTVWNVSID